MELCGRRAQPVARSSRLPSHVIVPINDLYVATDGFLQTCHGVGLALLGLYTHTYERHLLLSKTSRTGIELLHRPSEPRKENRHSVATLPALAPTSYFLSRSVPVEQYVSEIISSPVRRCSRLFVSSLLEAFHGVYSQLRPFTEGVFLGTDFVTYYNYSLLNTLIR
jgi:hypothetical protein